MLQFRSSSVITANISDIRPNTVRQELSVSSVEKATLKKDARIEKKGNLNVPTVKDHMLQTTKGVQPTKKQVFRQHVVTTKKVTPLF